MSTRSNSILLSSTAQPTALATQRAPRGTSAAAAAAAANVAAALSRSARAHKERSKNFTELEKRTVLELIAQHRDVLRQGRSNSATNKSKQLVWSAICSEVNKRCRSERPRTPAQVKMWYENYKKKCKMRGGLDQAESGVLLDGLLWPTLHNLSESMAIKDEAIDGTESPGSASEQLPVNMKNGRHSCSENDDSIQAAINFLEPHVQIIQQASPQSSLAPSPCPAMAHRIAIATPTPADTPPTIHRIDDASQSIDNSDSNMPLNLSHPDEPGDEPSVLRLYGAGKMSTDGGIVNGRFPDHADVDQSFHESRHNRTCCSAQESSPSEEEKLYYLAKRQHAIWEHEARMKILNMELKQKEEIYSMQRQLFLIELKLKMDLIEKNYGK